ncbi:hypothetical protein KUCAC02_031508 [Chaenocephalus aceratus]|nr:hypothetical protein KUCAC02_031508 [Chaenocephalus aceratus]
MHITIREGRSLPDLQRCTTCCEDFHCPFCASTVFQSAKLSKVKAHLESHFNRAVLHEGYTIHRCALHCRPEWHFHCFFYCQATLMRKADFIKHLALGKAKISAIIPDPANPHHPRSSDPHPRASDPPSSQIQRPPSSQIQRPPSSQIQQLPSQIQRPPSSQIQQPPSQIQQPLIIPDPATPIIQIQRPPSSQIQRPPSSQRERCKGSVSCLY